MIGVEEVGLLAALGIFLRELRALRTDIRDAFGELRADLRAFALGRPLPEIGRLAKAARRGRERVGGGDPAPVMRAAAGLKDESQRVEDLGDQKNERPRVQPHAGPPRMAETAG